MLKRLFIAFFLSHYLFLQKGNKIMVEVKSRLAIPFLLYHVSVCNWELLFLFLQLKLIIELSYIFSPYV